MASISETAQLVNIARSTLLYYERIGIVSPRRNPDNGYRDYSPDDINSLLLVRQLVQAGFSLREASDIIAGKLDTEVIETRYQALESQIDRLIMAKEVLQALLVRATGNAPSEHTADRRGRHWHAEFERTGSEAHTAWLRRLGFSDKECQYIRWVTRNISDVDTYMQNFFTVFEHMKRQGPGSTESTLKALNNIPVHHTITSLLDIGCGTGASSLVLAKHTSAHITAVDNHQPFLDRLNKHSAAAGLEKRITVMNRSMFDLEFAPESFDLIWSEGSAYFMGFEHALREWISLLTTDGYLFVSDAVWLTDTPSSACAEYWRIEYPGMTDVDTRKKQAEKSGYDIITWFILPREDWTAFYNDMEQCVNRSVEKYGMTQTYSDMYAEIEKDRTYGDEYGYLCLLLKRRT